MKICPRKSKKKVTTALKLEIKCPTKNANVNAAHARAAIAKLVIAKIANVKIALATKVY